LIVEHTAVHPDRRKFLIGAGALPLAGALKATPASAQQSNSGVVPDFPDMRNFRTGDLLWPKRKRSGLVARSGTPIDKEDRQAWEELRKRMRDNPQAVGLSPEVAERLGQMSYSDFEQQFFSVAPAELPRPAMTPRGAVARFSVGHVGLIEVQPNGGAYIVEATPFLTGGRNGGVVRVSYSEWLSGYSNIQVWHGRFRDIDAAAGIRLVETAKAQIGKPYDLFNFDLNDDSSFYCSKLVWFCAWRALNVAVDDNPDTRRGNNFPPWFSPKALIGAPHIEMLHSPGEY
jgi:hypothetical protein